MTRLSTLNIPGLQYVDLEPNLAYFISEKDAPRSGSKILKYVLKTTLRSGLEVLVVDDYRSRTFLSCDCPDEELIEALTGVESTKEKVIHESNSVF